MPAGQPFTLLCQALARPPKAGRADLHLHSTASDGTYSPASVVDLARRCGLSAMALTDHDTLAGVGPARLAAGSTVEVIAAVEITTEFEERELHLLGYFVDPEYPPLLAALADLRQGRIERYQAMVERLRAAGVSIPNSTPNADAVGRRHLAELLVQQGKAGSVREAFARWLGDHALACVPKKRLPVAEAIALVRAAGGVASWAHPPYDGSGERLARLARLGLGAVEAEYPDVPQSKVRQWRIWAEQLRLAVSGGSDCHGPGKRTVGACTISDADLQRLRQARG